MNFERIQLFFDNFHKLKNFDPVRDRIFVVDCSVHGERERERVEQFAKARGWSSQVSFERRANWGIDQGARVDYLDWLLDGRPVAPFVLQFQEHYLDNTSDYSRWPKYMGPRAGHVKEDVLPDGSCLDLDVIEQAFADPAVSVVFAARAGLGLFAHTDGREWFYTDGANLAFRAEMALSAFTSRALDNYRLVFDASYRWALFFEFEFGRCLSRGSWFDLMKLRSFKDAAELRKEGGAEWANVADAASVRRYQRYEGRVRKVEALPDALRKTLLATSFPVMCAAQTSIVAPLRSKLLARNINSPSWLREIW